MDFSSVNINAIAMECDDHGDITKDEKKVSMLTAAGFECERMKHNCMCKHKNFKSHHRDIMTVKDRKGC
jgi:hypothetical protein